MRDDLVSDYFKISIFITIYRRVLMKIAVSGGSGFIGKHIMDSLLDAGYDVTLFARTQDGMRHGISFVYADLMIPGDWQRKLAEHDIVINLVGVNLFQRWNEKIKKSIYDSRIISTANIVNSFDPEKSKGKTLINASAVGYYGLRGDEVITESADAGTDFLAKVCRDWELAALNGGKNNLRIVLLRFGSVFGSDGGAFPELRKNFKLMLGGKLGTGKQWFPWIHINDVAGIVLKAVSDKKMSGPYNCTSSGIVTNSEFTEIMAKAVRRPVLIPFVPGFVLRIVLGEFGSFLTGGQRAVPERLLKEGYRFKFPELHNALENLLK
jgi:hypothetical protein